MAWTDAARAASLAARRLHARAKVGPHGNLSPFHSAHKLKAHRNALARAIRRFRRGHRSHLRTTEMGFMSSAVRATRLRNIMRKAHK